MALSRRFEDNLMNSASDSQPTNFRLSITEATPVVELPENGSNTKFPSIVLAKKFAPEDGRVFASGASRILFRRLLGRS